MGIVLWKKLRGRIDLAVMTRLPNARLYITLKNLKLGLSTKLPLAGTLNQNSETYQSQPYPKLKWDT